MANGEGRITEVRLVKRVYSIDLWCFLGFLGRSELENKLRTYSKA
jgi:hypothetical protein